MDTHTQRQTEAHTISITHMDRHVATPAAAAADSTATCATDAALWPSVGCPGPGPQVAADQSNAMSSEQLTDTCTHSHTHADRQAGRQAATCKDCK